MMTPDFDALLRPAATGRRVRVAVVCATDAATIRAVNEAESTGLVVPTFVGDGPADVPAGRHIPAPDAAAAARRAVALVHEGRADVIMKGLVNTDVLLRAVLDKDAGLLPAGAVMSHLAVAAVPALGRLVCFSDAAVIPFPTPVQRRAQLHALIAACRRLGEAEPRVALIHCSEKVSDRFPVTADYRAIVAEARAGRWGRCRVDGPLDLLTAVSPEALAKKGLHSPLEGRADALVFPDIEAANVFYKAVTGFCGADTAGVLVGPRVPVVLTSRGDTERTKLHSLCLACRLAETATLA